MTGVGTLNSALGGTINTGIYYATTPDSAIGLYYSRNRGARRFIVNRRPDTLYMGIGLVHVARKKLVLWDLLIPFYMSYKVLIDI